MKTRIGFVSNSSSSSFIIAVRKKGCVCPTCKHDISAVLKAFDILSVEKVDASVMHEAMEEHKIYSDQAAEIIENLEQEISERKEDREWFHKYIDELNSLLADKSKVEVANRIFAILTNKYPNNHIHLTIRPQYTLPYLDEPIQHEISRMKNHTDTLDKFIEKKRKIADALKPYTDPEKWSILRVFDVDYYSSTDSFIKKLEEAGQVVIIDKITT